MVLLNLINLFNRASRRCSFHYGEHQRQQADLYLPADGATESKLVVFIYGGAWRSGERNDYRFVADALLAMGWSVLIPDYRLYPDVRFPAFIEDVAKAIAYLERNEDLLAQLPSGQIDKLVLMGHSAGAHIGALLAADRYYLQHAGCSKTLDGLIGLAGPYDLPLDDPDVVDVFEGQNEVVTNPVSLTNSDMPRTLLLHSSKDTRVFPFHSVRFTRALKLHAVPVDHQVFDNGSHQKIVGALARPLGFMMPVKQSIKSFLAGIE